MSCVIYEPNRRIWNRSSRKPRNDHEWGNFDDRPIAISYIDVIGQNPNLHCVGKVNYRSLSKSLTSVEMI